MCCAFRLQNRPSQLCNRAGFVLGLSVGLSSVSLESHHTRLSALLTQDIVKMGKRSPSSGTQPPLKLDPISEWRAWQALSVYFTVLLNRQIWRRWLLEHKCMEDRPVSQRFRPVTFLEPVPTLHKPRIPSQNNTAITKPNDKHNPYNTSALKTLKQSARLLRARVEKGKELASEIERRSQNPRITFPTHFCHTCVVGGDVVDVLLTQCGHRVCLTCLEFGTDANGVYECSICFAPAQFVARSPLGPEQRSCSEQISSVSKSILPRGKRAVVASTMWSPLVKPS